MLLKKFEDESEIESLIEVISFQFQIKIFFKHFENCHVSENSGPGLFVCQNQFGYCFHTNPGRVLKLPVGLNVAKGSINRICDIFENLPIELFSIRKYSLENDHQISVLEKTLQVRIEIWTRTTDNKHSNLQKVRSTFENVDIDGEKSMLPKIRLHLHKEFDLLLKITHKTLYFRGNLKLLK